MMTDIEIAQSVQMKPIVDIAKVAGIGDDYLEQYGKYKAKVDYKLLDEVDQPRRWSWRALHRGRS